MNAASADPPPMAEKRPARRTRVLLTGVVVFNDGRGTFKCTIHDITPSETTPTGARIKATEIPIIPKDVFLINVRERTAYPAHIIWATRTSAGLSLEAAIPLDRIADPKLNYLKVILDTHAPR